jgi:hypothetical protein
MYKEMPVNPVGRGWTRKELLEKMNGRGGGEAQIY